MFDIGTQSIEVRCECGRRHNATFNDVTNRRDIRCGCGVTIQLKDSDGSVRKSVSDINRSMKDFENALKRFGR